MIKGHMYAMLDYACLLSSLWGEAALMSCYLFNRTESRTLPAGKTLHEMLHGTQPNLSHLHVFGMCCFSHIPTELQQKLGPRSQEAIFMGYLPGVKAWCCHDTTTGAFFNSHDIIFDETLSNHLPTDSEDDDNDDIPPPAPPAPPPIPPHSTIIWHSGQIPIPAEKGQQL